MFGFVYWPWSESSTKILFRFLVLYTLVSTGCFKNFVVRFWKSCDSVWASIVKKMFNPWRSIRLVWLTQATDRLFKYVCICQSSSGTLVVEAVVGVGATVRVRQRSPCNKSSRDQSLSTSLLTRLRDLSSGILKCIACVASVSVVLRSKERPRNGIFGVLPTRKMGRTPKKRRGREVKEGSACRLCRQLFRERLS